MSDDAKEFIVGLGLVIGELPWQAPPPPPQDTTKKIIKKI